jgi:hypothetical protein
VVHRIARRRLRSSTGNLKKQRDDVFTEHQSRLTTATRLRGLLEHSPGDH